MKDYLLLPFFSYQGVKGNKQDMGDQNFKNTEQVKLSIEIG